LRAASRSAGPAAPVAVPGVAEADVGDREPGAQQLGEGRVGRVEHHQGGAVGEWRRLDRLVQHHQRRPVHGQPGGLGGGGQLRRGLVHPLE
jgi:hypothetical protein